MSPTIYLDTEGAPRKAGEMETIRRGAKRMRLSPPAVLARPELAEQVLAAQRAYEKRALDSGGFVCNECGRRFRSVAAAERAAWEGCPGCNGVDIEPA